MNDEQISGTVRVLAGEDILNAKINNYRLISRETITPPLHSSGSPRVDFCKSAHAKTYLIQQREDPTPTGTTLEVPFSDRDWKDYYSIGGELTYNGLVKAISEKEGDGPDAVKDYMNRWYNSINDEQAKVVYEVVRECAHPPLKFKF